MPRLPAISDLDAHVGFWLRYVSNHVSHAFAARVAAEGVTVAEWVMMRALYDRAPTAPSRVADDMGMTRGAITKLADRLIGKGLVLRKSDARDKRAQTLELTAAGEEMVPRLAALADRNDAEFFDHLPASEREMLVKLLRQTVELRKLTAVPTE
ncbi:MarR family transcriptional regulator [Bosea sp. 117]|uniref:MarR family winged helix-turn-helix transcriptional regulator n=1 Tax=Bosea sp. 117 TaxID=1125973 RepID=UPI00049434B6|nr:MarR family transcriptional regulator [Bosea sp. 117]